jgi:hypothetical protein
MRKWRAENKDKNKRNDLRCRVYRLARQKYGEDDSEEKQQFIENEIKRRLSRRMLLEQQKKSTLNELPFYCAPRHKIELPSINNRRPSQSNTEPSSYSNKSQSLSPMSDERRLSGSSDHSIGSNNNEGQRFFENNNMALPPMHLSPPLTSNNDNPYNCL